MSSAVEPAAVAQPTSNNFNQPGRRTADTGPIPFPRSVVENMTRGPGPAAGTPFHVIIIRVPEGWQPSTWRSLPPHRAGRLSYAGAVAAAVAMNEQRIRRAHERRERVNSWTVVCGKSSGHAVLNVDVPHGFDPLSPADMPPNAITVDEALRTTVALVKSMNRALLPDRHWAVILREMDRETAGELPCQSARPLRQPSAIARPSDFAAVQIGLVHPRFGTIATSPTRFSYRDTDCILSEARVAIVVANRDEAAAGRPDCASATFTVEMPSQILNGLNDRCDALGIEPRRLIAAIAFNSLIHPAAASTNLVRQLESWESGKRRPFSTWKDPIEATTAKGGA